MKREFLNFTPSDFSSLKKVDKDSFSAFSDFYAYRRLELPVYFHSVLELIGLGHFYYVIINDCLVVFRVTKMYGHYSCIVYFSPISLTNDICSEQIVFASLLRAGFSIRLTAGEVSRLQTNIKLKDDDFKHEFVYDLNKVVGMQGSAYHDIRCRVRKFDKEGGTVERGFSSDVIPFVKDWAKNKGAVSAYNRFLNFLSESDVGHFYITRLYIKDVLQAFSVIEKTGIYYSNVIGIINYNSTFDLAPGLAYYEAMGLPDRNTLIGAGGSRVPGLDAQKRRLRPAAIEPVYRVPPLVSRDNAYSLVKDFIG